MALMVPGKKKTEDRETYFGIIESDELELWDANKAVDEGFPAPQLFSLDVFPVCSIFQNSKKKIPKMPAFQEINWQRSFF